MKLHYIGLLVLAISYNNFFSQQLSPSIFKNELVNTNGIINDQLLVMKTMESQFPGYSEQVNKVFQKNKSRDNQSYNKNILHEISVVVHVVHQSPQENLPDSVIYSQIEVLNEDFQRLNADSNNLRTIFMPIAGNPNIKFNLVQIIRVPTTSSFSVGLTGLPDNVKQGVNGGSDAWNTDQYLNIWVCKLESFFGALFGYAYPPAGLSNWPAGSQAPSPDLDGVVLDYRAVGRNNPNPFDNGMGGSFVINGRTATHEVGHYFGMRHIWGDGGGIFGGSSCGEDDGISDTPNQGAQSNNNCDTTLNTCIDSVGIDLPDLIENHMDYSEELCKNMWTQMQSDFIRNVLENERVGLLNDNTGQYELTFDFQIYPNPANDFIHLFLPDDMGDLSVELKDIKGKTVYFSSQVQAKSSLDMRKLNKGVYFIKVTVGSISKTKKFVVK